MEFHGVLLNIKSSNTYNRFLPSLQMKPHGIRTQCDQGFHLRHLTGRLYRELLQKQANEKAHFRDCEIVTDA